MAKVADVMQKIAMQKKLYVAQALGIGEREDVFYNVGVFSTLALAQQALADLAEEMDIELETAIETYTLDLV